MDEILEQNNLESAEPEGTIVFHSPSIIERVEIMQKRVEEMCDRVEAYFTKPTAITLETPLLWKEVGLDWVECKKHLERFASDTICTRCVEDIIVGSL